MGQVWPLHRGRVYGARLGDLPEKYYLVVSNNQRNRKLDSVLAVRLTTSPKPPIPSIVEVRNEDAGLEGRFVCDDIVEIYHDEITRDIGAVSLGTMRRVAAGLLSALGLD